MAREKKIGPKKTDSPNAEDSTKNSGAEPEFDEGLGGNFEDETETDVVRTTVHRLRRKLQEGEDGPFLQTVYGVGFTLKPTAESVAASA